MDLSFTIRKDLGTSASKILRKKGLIPAELYGHKIKNEHIVVEKKAFEKVFKEAGTNTIIYLYENGASKNAGAKKAVIIHDVVNHRTKEEITSIDFYVVNMEEAISTKVPFEFINESPLVKEQGAIINKSMLEIEIESLPGNLPHSLDVDLSLLDELDKSIYVKDINIPKGVKVLVDEDTVIVSVSLPKEEVVAEPVDVSSVKVENEDKKLEKQSEKESEE
jgi:large subunit ribosomal protein L25